MELKLFLIEVVILLAKKFNIISKETQCVTDVISNSAVRYLKLRN
jgi:hypothetical protein